MHSIEDRLARWHAFVEGHAGPFMFQVNFPLPALESALPPAPPLWPEWAAERIERRWAEYEVMVRKAALVDDDRVPYLSNVTGTEIFAEAFGCKVHRPDEGMPFALPFIHSAAAADRVRTPALSTSSLAYLFDIADELYRRGGPGAVMKPVDVQSPMDIVALMWDKQDLYCALLDSPEPVLALAGKVQALLTAFFDEWFARYGTTFVAHYPDYVMHGGITVSVDEVGAVDPGMFRQFFRPELAALAAHFGGLGVHCCAAARHQWENFRQLPGLKVINHHAPPVGDPKEYLLAAVRHYGRQVAQFPIGWVPAGSPETWPAQFGPDARVVLEVAAADATAAGAIAARLQAARAAAPAGP